MAHIYLAIIVALVVAQHFERRDLYNRIMSKSLGEYKAGKPHQSKSAHDRAIERWRKRGEEE